jgi:type VI secretion system ImpH/TssG family protein
VNSIFDGLNSGSEQDFHHSVVALQASRGAVVNTVGTDTLPRNEAVRFKVPQHLGFPGKALERIDEAEGPNRPSSVYVNFMGLTGPNGVMPLYFSEWVMDNCKQKDNALRDFLDIFHHRLISLYHRAWEKYQFALQYQRQLHTQQRSPIALVLHSLAGTQDDTQQYLSGLFSNPVRSAQGLKQIVTLLSGCKVKVNERIGRWLAIAVEDQSCLTSFTNPEGQNAQLGLGAILGSKLWDIGSTVEIELYAESEQEVQRLMPGGRVLELLKKTAGDYLPLHVKPRWALWARYCDMPASRLGAKGMGLGRGSALAVDSQRMQQQTKIVIA